MSSPITDLLVFTDPVVVPDDADTLNAASVSAAGVGFQALADRTRNVANRTGGLVGAGEFLYLDGAGVAADRPRTRILGVANMMQGRLQVAAGQFWALANFTGGGIGLGLTSQSDFAKLVMDIGMWLPDGATLTRLRVLVQPGAARAGADRMNIFLDRMTPNFAVPAIPTYLGPLFQVFDNAGTGNQVISTGGITEAINRASALHLTIVAGNTAGTSKDDVFAIELQYDDPGPQNI